MSGFLGGGPANHGAIQGLASKDIRLIANQYRGDFYRWFFYEDAFVSGDYFVNPYWPGGLSLNDSASSYLHPVWYDLPAVNTGALSKLGFSGYTRDVNGVILGGCIVRLFRTSDGLKVCEVTSDPVTGWFVLDTQFYPDTHFYTAHKPSAVPEVAGASPSTLVAS